MNRHIVCAANKFELNGQEIIVTGARHYDPIMHAVIDALSEQGQLIAIPDVVANQGFIDNFGKWLSREDARACVLENEQVLRSQPNSSELFSEDLY